MTHVLGLDINDTISCTTMRIADASIYQTGFDISNIILEVTPPNKNCAVVFDTLSQYFSLILNSANLNLVQSSSQAYNIPDGNYKIKYSINPNTKIFVEHNHFRTCKINNLLKAKIRDLYNEECTIKKSEFKQKENDLIEINFMIKAAKSFAEDDKDFKKANDLYNEANSRLKNSNECSTC